MVFEFSMIRLGTGGGFGEKYIYHPFPLSTLKATVSKWQTFIEGTDSWTTVFCENHDNGRAVSRFGDSSTPELWARSAKTLALWQATLTGTLFLYQGQEIGMKNMPADWSIEEYKDIESSNFYTEAVRSGDEKRVADTMAGLRILARDHSRIPFQWDDSHNAGFTGIGAKPWMRVHDEYREINAKKQLGEPESILNFYRKALRLRKRHADVFIRGSFKLLEPENEAVFSYVKESAQDTGTPSGTTRKALVVLNFSREYQPSVDAAAALGCKRSQVAVLISTFTSDETTTTGIGVQVALRPWEGRVYVNFE
jgi:alpha-glucosidase